MFIMFLLTEAEAYNSRGKEDIKDRRQDFKLNLVEQVSIVTTEV
jgi:hypothetical protein